MSKVVVRGGGKALSSGTTTRTTRATGEISHFI